MKTFQAIVSWPIVTSSARSPRPAEVTVGPASGQWRILRLSTGIVAKTSTWQAQLKVYLMLDVKV